MAGQGNTPVHLVVVIDEQLKDGGGQQRQRERRWEIETSETSDCYHFIKKRNVDKIQNSGSTFNIVAMNVVTWNWFISNIIWFLFFSHTVYIIYYYDWTILNWTTLKSDLTAIWGENLLKFAFILHMRTMRRVYSPWFSPSFPCSTNWDLILFLHDLVLVSTLNLPFLISYTHSAWTPLLSDTWQLQTLQPNHNDNKPETCSVAHLCQFFLHFKYAQCEYIWW